MNIEIKNKISQSFESILTDQALAFVAHLHNKYNATRKELLHKRIKRQESIEKGIFPSFLPETKSIREGQWTVSPIPNDLQDRRVEITGPVERKMIINALNSGAKVFMADFEDSNSPTWQNTMEGQINLRDAIRRTISFKNENGKEYKLNENVATLMVRPRGWHMTDKNILINNEAISASMLDFGLFFFHNAKILISQGTGPYFYLPKIESHEEARLWNSIFMEAQNFIQIPQGTIKATVLIETITASFEMHEILYELREHSAGLNCGRWDYIFSYIKKFKNFPEFVTPDRTQITMTSPFMKAYSDLVIQTCHKRNIHAMGGMAAQIPVKNDDKANEIAFAKVRADKEREVMNGHDGTWVAHPALVAVAMDVFNKQMRTPNQIHIKRDDVHVTNENLIEVPKGTVTEQGLRLNINVGILYIESWLRGNGAAALHNLMEDAATAEISRTQVWQWLRHKAILQDGREINNILVDELIQSEMEEIKKYVGDKRFAEGRFNEALPLFKQLIYEDEYQEFLTKSAYEILEK